MQTATSFEPRSFLHRTERGELRLSVPAPTVFLFEYRGFTDDDFMQFVEKTWDEQFGKADFPVQVFADTAGQTGYTTGFRTRMMTWTRKMIGQTNEYVLLVKSRWVAMGIAMVRSTVGLPSWHVEVSTKRDVFQSKLDTAVRKSFERGSPR
jgi:hypothetical protein